MSSFVIKSFQNGINLRMNPDVDFEQLLKEIAEKFQSSRAFFGSSSVALSIEGRILNAEEEMAVLDVIQNSSDLNVMCIIGKDDALNNNFIKAIQTLQNKLPSGNYMHVYGGTLKDNDVIEMEESILVLGDVNPGCSVTSSKNIIILGGLYGEAYAGKESGKEAYVIALEMEPSSLMIGNFKYKQTKKSKWRIQPKLQPKVAVVREDNIELLPLTKEILENL
ncbi:MAG: septum site-determining protein MinC [Lachnospiraceae bacterium]|nr:septum site-determining protein MinC [Lachnospiraceae bacterium]